MHYFWKSQADIPEGTGYPIIGWQHLLCLILITAFIIYFCRIFMKISAKMQTKCLKLIPVLLLVLEIWKDTVLTIQSRMNIGYLPLHLCSMGIPLFFLQAYINNKKSKAVFGEISFCLIMPGAAFALFDPDWTTLYPMFNFFNLHSYIWHMLLVLFPILLFIKGEIHPSLKHYYWNVLFLCCVVPPIYIFDKINDCNYFFINWPLPASPLELFFRLFGNPGYLAGYAVLVLLAVLIVYIPFINDKKCPHKDKQGT